MDIKYWNRNFWSLIVLVTLVVHSALSQITRNIEGLSYECGGFVEILDPLETGTITSPNYPGHYPSLARCIWLFQTPKEYALTVSLSGMLGEGNAGTCVDFLEIRNGSAQASQLYYECNSPSKVDMTGYSRWFWVKFESDWTTTNSGFQMNYSVVADPGNSADSSPVINCFAYEFVCPNKECMAWSYRCDGDNDCGCSSDGCDEIACGGLNWSEAAKVGVGVGVGVAVFILVFIGVGLLDICMKKRAEIKYKKQMADAEKRAKIKKAQKMAQNFLMSAAEGAKLNVPSIDLNASMSSTSSTVKS